MIRTLAWKEYREQRGLWMAIAVMGAILSVAVSSFARGGISQVANDSFVASFVIGLFITLMVAQGVVCGVQLLAGEKETGTLAFLDALSVLRFPVWWTKVLVGLAFVLAQALVLFVIALALNVAIWGHLVGFVVAGVFAYCWGLLGGALCDKVFAAIAAAIGLGIASYIAIPLVPIVGLIVFLVAPPIFVVLSARRFGTPDLQRGLYRGLLAMRRPQEGPAGWVTLVWLAEKQGRWILWPGLLVSFLAGFVSFLPPDLMWLSVTLIIGLVCGGAVFGPEQAGEQDRFLGAQRLPPWQVWLVKTLFWMLAAAGMSLMFALAFMWRMSSIRPSRDNIFLFEDLARQNLALFLTLAVVHGLCIGQFCSLLSRKVVVAGFLGSAIGLVLFTLWLPSLIFGGVHGWQILGAPVILLFATRMSMWAWYSGRLYTRRHFFGLAACVALVALWLSGGLWYRVLEVPNVGEPFDVGAFEAKLEQAKESPAVPLIHKAMDTLNKQINKIDNDWPPFTKTVISTSGLILAAPVRPNPIAGVAAPKPTDEEANKEDLQSLIPKNLLDACIQILGQPAPQWPKKDKELGPRLDALFAGSWVRDLDSAGAMPLGLNKWTDSWNQLDHVFNARQLQLFAKEDFAGAWNNLRIRLALASQFEYCQSDSIFGGIPSGRGWELEFSVLGAINQWLRAVGPRPDLLQSALASLQEHEKKSPDPLDNIKADYLVLEKSLQDFWSAEKRIITPNEWMSRFIIASPWETARRLRFLKAIYASQIQLAKMTPVEWSKVWPHDPPGKTWTSTGLFPTKEWGGLLKDRFVMSDKNLLPKWPHDFPLCLRYVRLRQVAIGLMLYQAAEGHAAAQLRDLVPRYLPTLPLDPCTGQPFEYQVSKGEEMDVSSYSGLPNMIKLDPGQGFLSMNPVPLIPGFDTPYTRMISRYFAVPVWSKEKE